MDVCSDRKSMPMNRAKGVCLLNGFFRFSEGALQQPARSRKKPKHNFELIISFSVVLIKRSHKCFVLGLFFLRFVCLPSEAVHIIGVVLLLRKSVSVIFHRTKRKEKSHKRTRFGFRFRLGWQHSCWNIDKYEWPK